ncbi:unnamed protein product [Penicillium camemberti]|uniref:Str. FM013 n=1 Tax=Penicillium camemberti (strain FM 013) TaxID=1429867 RepID=A0A0G4PXY3_PENC3|nr:unnamed protein product [Penicillium camemberti]
MKDRKHLSRARALTRDLERAMDKFEPALASTTSQAMPVAGILGPAFEYDRARRSTALSPEMMPTPNLNQDKGDLEYSKSDARDGGQPSLADSVDKAAEWLEQLCRV